MLNKKKTRQSEPVNAGSMADIAFLLLIFFLVTATIIEDQGIYVKLPPWDPDERILEVDEDNVLAVLVNAQNKLLVEGKITPLDRLRAVTKEFITNPGRDPHKPTLPKNAVVSIINDRGTNYATYLAVYNEIKGAYNELWETAAQNTFGRPYETLPTNDKQSIRAEIPLAISEAEPTDHEEKTE